MDRNLLTRRQFNERCAALALALPAFAHAAGNQSQPAAHTVKLPDGTSVPMLGQGAWHLGQDRHPAAVETEALLAGLSLGMTLVDTSGNYGRGRSEKFLGQAMAGRRDDIYLVTKVEDDEVDGDGIAKACAASLARLATDRIDLYLLHAPVPTAKFAHVVAAFEALRKEGKIRAWGVSNFDTQQMRDLMKVPDGTRCATNQVEYSLKERGIERDLLPWCAEHRMPVMAYSPLGGDHNLVIHDATLMKIGAAHGCPAAAVALAWVMRSGNVIAIPEAGSPAHIREDAAALGLTLTPEDLKALDAAFP